MTSIIGVFPAVVLPIEDESDMRFEENDGSILLRLPVIDLTQHDGDLWEVETSDDLKELIATVFAMVQPSHLVASQTSPELLYDYITSELLLGNTGMASYITGAGQGYLQLCVFAYQRKID